MLDGKVAVVTGGSAGIGRATAEKYLEFEANVLIANRSAESGRTTAEELGCDFVQCDVAEHEQVNALVETTVEEYGRLDVIVNNAVDTRVFDWGPHQGWEWSPADEYDYLGTYGIA